MVTESCVKMTDAWNHLPDKTCTVQAFHTGIGHFTQQADSVGLSRYDNLLYIYINLLTDWLELKIVVRIVIQSKKLGFNN